MINTIKNSLQEFLGQIEKSLIFTFLFIVLGNYLFVKLIGFVFTSSFVFLNLFKYETFFIFLFFTYIAIVLYLAYFFPFSVFIFFSNNKISKLLENKKDFIKKLSFAYKIILFLFMLIFFIPLLFLLKPMLLGRMERIGIAFSGFIFAIFFLAFFLFKRLSKKTIYSL